MKAMYLKEGDVFIWRRVKFKCAGHVSTFQGSMIKAVGLYGKYFKGRHELLALGSEVELVKELVT